MKRSEIVSHARQWIGTPFHHQASVIGVGCDCGGLCRGVAAEIDYCLVGIPLDYGREPASGNLVKVLDRYLVQLVAPRPGDIMLFKFKTEPQHLAICTDIGMIHAYQPYGAVVEHRFDDKWRNRLCGAWGFKGVIDG